MDNEIEKRKSNIKNILFGWIKDNHDKIFLVVLILAFIIRLWIFFKTLNQPFWWDEADYLSAAKKWAGINPHLSDIWYYRRGFLWPLIGTLFFKIGLGEIGMRLLEVIFSTGIVVVSYFLVSKMFNKKMALFVSFGLTFSWILLFFTGRVLTDIPSAFFILLSLLLFWKGYVLKEGNKFLYLFGLVFALAILTRMQSFMLAPPFLIYIFIKEKFKMFKNKKLWITLGIFVLLLVPQFVLYSIHYGNPITDIASHYLGITTASNIAGEGEVRGFSMAVFNYLKDLPYILSTPILIFFFIGIIYFFADLFLGIDKIFKSELLQNKLFVIYWILSLFLIMGYIGSVSYVEQRYITAGLPFLFLIALSPMLLIENLLAKQVHLNKKIISFILVVILFLAFIPSIALGNQLINSKLNSYSEIKEAGLWIKENSNASDLIITQSRPQIVYYSERSVQKGELNMFENQSFFEGVIKELKPKYVLISVYEQSPDWVYSYPEQSQSMLIPVKVFYQNQQPTIIIYEIKYS